MSKAAKSPRKTPTRVRAWFVANQVVIASSLLAIVGCAIATARAGLVDQPPWIRIFGSVAEVSLLVALLSDAVECLASNARGARHLSLYQQIGAWAIIVSTLSQLVIFVVSQIASSAATDKVFIGALFLLMIGLVLLRVSASTNSNTPAQ